MRWAVFTKSRYNDSNMAVVIARWLQDAIAAMLILQKENRAEYYWIEEIEK